jgi:muconate cycloisomerase
MRLALHRVRIPMRGSFEHARAARDTTDNLIVAVTLTDGTIGYGEGVPRDYVTGETMDIAWSALSAIEIEPTRVDNIAEAVAYAARVAAAIPDGAGYVANATRAAIELALLDAYGKSFGVSIGPTLIAHAGTRPGTVCAHSAVLDRKGAQPERLRALLSRFGFRAAKIKVGFSLDEDLATIAAVRAVMGSDADLRLDANRAWTFDDAVAVMTRARDLGVTVVEDPLRGELDAQLADLRRLREEHAIRIVLDEPIRTRAEAERAIAAHAVDVFNLRVSKNGGLVATCAIARLAQDHGIGLQVGTQVGETAILSAAGRHLAYAAGPVVYMEGSAEQLKYEPAHFLSVEDLTFDATAHSSPLTSPGLGITILPERLAAFTTATCDIIVG